MRESTPVSAHTRKAASARDAVGSACTTASTYAYSYHANVYVHASWHMHTHTHMQPQTQIRTHSRLLMHRHCVNCMHDILLMRCEHMGVSDTMRAHAYAHSAAKAKLKAYANANAHRTYARLSTCTPHYRGMRAHRLVYSATHVRAYVHKCPHKYARACAIADSHAGQSVLSSSSGVPTDFRCTPVLCWSYTTGET